MVVVVDIREKRSGIPAMLERMGIPIEIKELPVADYIVGNVAVERKTVGDYLQSKFSGRLDRQLYDLSRNFELSYLIVEGFVTEALMEHKIPRFAYVSSLVGSSLKRAPDGKQGQIITVNLDTKYDTALFLKALHKKLTENDIVRLPKMVKTKLNPDELLVYVVSSFPDIGEKRAIDLLKKFKTIRNLVNASENDLVTVKGIGKKLASKLYQFFNQKFEEG